jgi:hypothetical protein
MDQTALQQKVEVAKDFVGVSVGGGFFSVAFLADISTIAQALTMIFGCGISAVTFVHFTHRYIRYRKNPEEE